MTNHLSPSEQSSYGPICGDQLGVGDSLISLGAGYDRVYSVDCQRCWEIIIDIYFIMDSMGVTMRELEKNT